MHTYTLGVLSSHSGTNLEAIAQAIERGDLHTARIGVVICNNPGERTFAVAQRFGIPVYLVNNHTDADRDQAIQDYFAAYGVDIVVLAGYNRKLAPVTVQAYPGRVLNIHPGPLPLYGGKGMYGEHVHRAVLHAGLRHTRTTIHIVDNQYDHGPELAHRTVPILPGDTPTILGERVYAAGRELYWRTILAFTLKQSFQPKGKLALYAK